MRNAKTSTAKCFIAGGLAAMIAVHSGPTVGWALSTEGLNDKSLDCLYDAKCSSSEGSPAGSTVLGVIGDVKNKTATLAQNLSTGQTKISRTAKRSIGGFDGIGGPSGSTHGVVNGIKHGAGTGMAIGALTVMYPANLLFRAGRIAAYDNLGLGLGLKLLGCAAATVLFLPAIFAGVVGGAVGAVAGAGSEMVDPYSTGDWGADRELLWD